MGMLDELLGGLMQGGLSGGTPDSRQGMPGAQAGMPGGMPGMPAGMPGMGAAGGGALLAIILQLLQSNGGLSGMLQRMQQSGYGDQAQSWIGTGQNQGLPTDALSQIFGSGALEQLAQQFGMSKEQASSQVAQALPEVVNRMTPAGSIPDDGDDLVSRTLNDLMRGQR